MKRLWPRYGENPHQKAAFYKRNWQGSRHGGIKQLHGKELSYNNIVDNGSCVEYGVGIY